MKLRTTAVIAAGLLLASSQLAAAAEPARETIAAWETYLDRADRPALWPHDGATIVDGAMIAVDGGTIHDWRGSTLVHHTTVDRVIRALMYPGTPPPQEDVLASRVLSRSGDSLRVYLKLSRTAIVTAVYDTEHDVTFARHSPSLATSRSVSTRITESGGDDHGFLWRLNSYWRYLQDGDAVRIEVRSISLSRAVPAVARPVARPIINHIARESLERTLTSLRRFLETG